MRLQDYPPDCCSGASTTIIIISYLIHYIPVPKYLGAVFCLMLLPHTDTYPMCLPATRAAASHCFQIKLPTNCSVFTQVYYASFTSSLMIMSLRLLKHLLPSFPLPLRLFSTLVFVQMEEKPAETESHPAEVTLDSKTPGKGSVSQSDRTNNQAICAREMSTRF